MGEAIGQILPLAVGVALSPIPIVAVVLILGTERARTNGLAFVVGWLVGLAAVGVIVLSAAGDASESGEPATWTSILKLVLGALLFVLAVKEWRRRPAGGEEPTPPKWMASLDELTPVRSCGAGVLLSAVNPKNLVLAVVLCLLIGAKLVGDAIGALA